MMQYYGIAKDKKTALYVAMSIEQVAEYIKKHPDAGIAYIADKFNILYFADDYIKHMDAK